LKISKGKSEAVNRRRYSQYDGQNDKQWSTKHYRGN